MGNQPHIEEYSIQGYYVASICVILKIFPPRF